MIGNESKIYKISLQVGGGDGDVQFKMELLGVKLKFS